MEPIKLRQNAANILAVIVYTTGIICLLKGFVRFAPAHVAVKQSDESLHSTCQSVTYVLFTVGNKLMSLR